MFKRETNKLYNSFGIDEDDRDIYFDFDSDSEDELDTEYFFYIEGWVKLYEDFKKNKDYHKLPKKYRLSLSIKHDYMVDIMNNRDLYELDDKHFEKKEIKDIMNHYKMEMKRLIHVVIYGVANE